MMVDCGFFHHYARFLKLLTVVKGCCLTLNALNICAAMLVNGVKGVKRLFTSHVRDFFKRDVVMFFLSHARTCAETLNTLNATDKTIAAQ